MPGRKSIKRTAWLIQWTCWLVRLKEQSIQATHRWLAMVCLPDAVQKHVLDENSHSFQYERHKQIHVDVVSCAVQLPVIEDKSSVRRRKSNMHNSLNEFPLIKDLKWTVYTTFRKNHLIKCFDGTKACNKYQGNIHKKLLRPNLQGQTGRMCLGWGGVILGTSETWL